jgi:hypothetical protein
MERNVWTTMAEEGYREVDERFPVADAKNTRVNSAGEVVNMDREAMLARVNAFVDRVNGKINPDGDLTRR